GRVAETCTRVRSCRPVSASARLRVSAKKCRGCHLSCGRSCRSSSHHYPLASAGVTPGGRSADGRGRREGTWASQGCLARALLANGGEGCDENSLLGPAVRGGWRSGLAACRLTGSGSGVEVHRACPRILGTGTLGCPRVR